MAGRNSIRVASAVCLAVALMPGRAAAQAARAAECAARSTAAAEAVKRRASVALYYELKLTLAGGRVYEWRDAAPARLVMSGAGHLGTGSRHSMAIRADGKLWTWGAADGPQPRQVLSEVATATGGDNDTLAIRDDGTVRSWRVGRPPRPVDLPR